MLSKTNEKERQLVLCDLDINGGDPIFLEIGNHHPVALFGGEGEIIFINRNSVKNSQKSLIKAVFLPDNEKASSFACCEDSLVNLSLNGGVFESPIEKESSVLNFSEVEELKDKEIVCISGTFKHCVAVTKEGRIFGRGSNGNGRVGFGKERKESSSFIKISLLNGYEIRAAYAGCHHSLFETREGKILSCRFNINGELLLSCGPSENVFSPIETMITSGATFCIVGSCLSVVFIGNSPPPNSPNIRIQQYK